MIKESYQGTPRKIDAIKIAGEEGDTGEFTCKHTVSEKESRGFVKKKKREEEDPGKRTEGGERDLNNSREWEGQK